MSCAIITVYCTSNHKHHGLIS